MLIGHLLDLLVALLGRYHDFRKITFRSTADGTAALRLEGCADCACAKFVIETQPMSAAADTSSSFLPLTL